MLLYRIAKLAERDLEGITDYTTDRWGEEQAIRYVNDLKDCFQGLADAPLLGRPCSGIRPGYRRVEHGSHVILYRQDADGIFISRILHRKMLPVRHVIE